MTPEQVAAGWKSHDGYDWPPHLKQRPAIPVEVVYDDGSDALIWSDETAWTDNTLYGPKRHVVVRYREFAPQSVHEPNSIQISREDAQLIIDMANWYEPAMRAEELASGVLADRLQKELADGIT